MVFSECLARELPFCDLIPGVADPALPIDVRMRSAETFYKKEVQPALKKMRTMCSMIATWGSRTENVHTWHAIGLLMDD